MKTFSTRLIYSILATCFLGFSVIRLQASEDVLFEDFEGADWGAWTATGTAFGDGPVTSENSPADRDGLGGVGGGVANSHSLAPGATWRERDGQLGTLTSPSFAVERSYIHFFVGGGDSSDTRVVLLDALSGAELRSSSGRRSSLMHQDLWDVSALIGREVKIRLEDKDTGVWGNIGCDHIVFSDNESISIPGFASAEVWTGIYEFTVSSLVQNDRFYGSPDAERFATSSFTDVSKYTGNRIRGYITAPETGKYTFWVSSSTAAELWLSEDETKYRKNRIAYNGGIPWNSENFWDQFSSQMSEEVELVAGERYYIEILSQQHHSFNQHIRFAWARPAAGREPIPSEFLATYAQEAEDADDDYLPDTWEVQFGLDPLDNGLIDRARQGERGDFDLDGLSNREEFLYGTDPSNPDTDGDGLVDSTEVRNYETDPNVSDAPSESVVGTIDLTTFAAAEDWKLTSQGLIPPSFRGAVGFNFSVPEDGHWTLNVDTTLLGDLYLHETVDVGVMIDGVSMGINTLVFGQDREASLRILTPYLTAGSHSVSLDFLNMSARRTVSIRQIDVIQPQGADLDSDGIPDWIFSQLDELNTLYPYRPVSRTSPAFLEGTARMRATVILNDGPVLPGTDQTHWYVGLPLDPVSPTAFTLSLEEGLTETGSINWEETNILGSETVIIRKNDSLKLVAKPVTGATGQSVALTSAPVNWALDPEATASQSSTRFGAVASRAIDGNTGGMSPDDPITFTRNDVNTWWKTNLGADRRIASVRIWNREDRDQDWLSNYRVSVVDSEGGAVVYKDFHTAGGNSGTTENWVLDTPVIGREVKIEFLGPNSAGRNILALAEVEVFSEGIEQTLASDEGHFIFQFTEAGTKTITATYSDGSTGTLTVIVKQADFSDTPRDLISNSVGNLQFNLSDVDSDLHFAGGSYVPIQNPATVSGDSFSLQASPRTIAGTNMLARLYEGGPIIGVQPLNFIGVSDAIQNDLISAFASNDYPGYQLISTPIVLTDLPEGGSVVITIFRAGVTFLDGTKELTLTAEDFVNGIYTLEFLYPEGQSGGYCHYTDIYDRGGNYVGRR